MITRHFIVSDDPDSPQTMESIDEAVSIIESGGLVALPTETVYGLGALGLCEKALAKIFIAKKRPLEDPLILHLGDIGWVDELSSHVPDSARLLMNHFWPGPLTLILAKSGMVPDFATAGLPSVAMRMPSHPVTLPLLEKLGKPLAAPSANLFGYTSPTMAGHVIDDLKGRIDAVLDAGPTNLGVESTVLDIRKEDMPLILRPGGVTRDDIEKVLGINVLFAKEGPAAAAGPAVSPGLLAKHYSPKTQMRLFESKGRLMPDEMKEGIVRSLADNSVKTGVLAYNEDREILEKLNADPSLQMQIEYIGAWDDTKCAAMRLYAAMRSLDISGAGIIFARLSDNRGIGESINDRLRRAAFTKGTEER